MPLHLDVAGPPDAPAIAFLHGVGTAGWMWWQQVPAFADYRCLTLDLPGHGDSSAVPWRSLTDAAGQVAAVIRAHAVTGTAHVVGLSLGGQVALALLAQNSDVLDRVVVSGVTIEPWQPRWLVAPQVWATSRMLRSRRLVDAQFRSLSLPPLARAAAARAVRAMSPQTYRRIAAEVAGYSLPPGLDAVATPTLVLAGSTESEPIRRPVEALPSVLPHADGRIAPGAGHGWNVEAPRLFNATTRAWIEGSPLPADLVRPPTG